MRTGLIAKKVGMSRVFKADGSNIPVTLLKVDNCKVIEHKILEKNGYSALRISYGVSKKTKINKPTKGFFKKIKNEGSNTTKEFRVSKDAFLDIGSILLTSSSDNSSLNSEKFLPAKFFTEFSNVELVKLE